MFNIRKKITHALTATVMGAALLVGGMTDAKAADQELIDAAKAEGKVVWYTTLLVNNLARPLKEAFEAKYGIEVEMVNANTGDLYKRITTEAGAGQLRADVNDGFSTATRLFNAGVIDPYIPKSAEVYDSSLIHPDGNHIRAISYFLGTAINSDLVDEADYPKTLEDLLDPKWKGKMVWAAGPLGGGPNFLGVILAMMGEEKGMEFIKAFAEQDIINLPSNQRVVLDSVISGENLIGIGMFNHHVPISQAKGAPVEFLPINPVHAIGAHFYLLKGPNRNAGKLFLDFVMSEDAQKVIAEANYIPTHPNVGSKNPILKPDTGGFADAIYTITPEWIAENAKRNTAIYEEYFVNN
jgi:iron(III) transport system substrate-binding protein